MGNSTAPANAPSELARVPSTITVYNQKLDRYFQVTRQGSDLYQTEYQLDESGNKVFTTTQKLEYVVGGPSTGYTYVIRLGQFLFEAPLSYYLKAKQWDLSPGYGAMDVAFNRPILTGCLACHNGQPEPVPNRDGMYRDPPFRFMEYGISCECCHGPGQLHVQELTHHRKPGLVCINRRGEDAAKPIPLLTKLLTYAEVSQKDPSLSRYYFEVLEQLRKTTPDDPSVLAALGRKAVQEKDDAKAVEYLTRTLQAGTDQVATYIDLSEALAHLGRVEESAKILEQGVATWPFSPEIQKALVLRYVTLKQFPQAHEAVKQYVALFPEDAFMRGVLARLEGRPP